MPLLIVFLLSFVGALVYQRVKRRAWGRALQFSLVFGFATMLIIFLGAVVLEIVGVLPPVRFSA